MVGPHLRLAERSDILSMDSLILESLLLYRPVTATISSSLELSHASENAYLKC